jgi:alpha-beta hydrolase superfamily lysophospholipase
LLAAQGYPVILPDRRGSGLNEADRGDTPSPDRWFQDLDELADWAEQEFGVAGLDLVGVSWGGKPALSWTLSHPARVARLLLIAPGFFPAVDVGLRERFQIARSLLTGGKQSFGIPLDDPALFTQNPEKREFISRDPLKLDRATARFLWHSRRLDRRLRRATAGQLQAETLGILAENDQIIRNRPTEAYILRVGGNHARVVTLSGAAHTLEFEADGARFREYLERWGADGLQVKQ